MIKETLAKWIKIYITDYGSLLMEGEKETKKINFYFEAIYAKLCKIFKS